MKDLPCTCLKPHCDFAAASHWAGVKQAVFSLGNGLVQDPRQVTSELTARSLPSLLRMTATHAIAGGCD